MILLIIIAVVILVGFLLLGSEKSKHNNCILCSELTELDEKYCFYCQAKLNLNDTITYSDLRGHLKKNIQLLVRYYPKYLEIAKKFGIQDEATKQYNEASYNLKLEKYSKYRRIQVEEVEEECDDFLYESGRKIGKEVIRNLKKEKRELIESINIELDLLNIEIIKNISVLKNKRNILSYSNEYGVIQKSKWENEIIKYINMVKPGLILKYEKQNMRIRQIDREIEAVKMHKSNLENDFVNTKLIKSNEVDIRKLIE